MFRNRLLRHKINKVWPTKVDVINKDESRTIKTYVDSFNKKTIYIFI